MRPEIADPAYLWDMLDAAKAIREFVQGKTFEEYQTDRMLRGAVERHLEVIGEAAGRVSKPFRERHLEIPWRSVIGQRHVLIHEYGEIRQDLIWRVATVHIQQLIASLESLLPSPPDTET